MVYMKIYRDGAVIKADCHKNVEDGEFFQLIMDPTKKTICKDPIGPDIDASAACTRLHAIVEAGEDLPMKTVSAWG